MIGMVSVKSVACRRALGEKALRALFYLGKHSLGCSCIRGWRICYVFEFLSREVCCMPRGFSDESLEEARKASFTWRSIELQCSLLWRIQYVFMSLNREVCCTPQGFRLQRERDVTKFYLFLSCIWSQLQLDWAREHCLPFEAEEYLLHIDRLLK
jgi:hypothetical protein